MVGMKRLAAAFLWGFTLWIVGSTIAMLLEMPDVLGPTIGIATGFLVGVDPHRVIWPTSTRTPSPTS